MSRAGAATPTVRFAAGAPAVGAARSSTPNPSGAGAFMTSVDVSASKASAVSSSSAAASTKPATTPTQSITRNKLASAIARDRGNEASGLVQGTKQLEKIGSSNRKVFVRCADDMSIQPWPLKKAIANVAVITGDMELMQRHGLLDPSTELHPLFSLDQMRRLYEARCADAKRPVSDERLARFCETLGNYACGEQFIMREMKFEAHSIRAIAGIFSEGGLPASISHLDLSGNNLGSDGGRLIAQVLPELKELCVLRLGSANLGDGIAAIAAALRDNQSVTHFDLSATHCGAHRNSIIGDTVRVLSTMLRRNRVLAHIDLSNTSIKQSGPILMDSMALCRSLVHVALRDNGLGHDCAEPLAKMVAQLRHLETLDLAENQLNASAIELLCRALCSRKVERGASTVLRCLNVSKNRIDAAAEDAIQAICDVIETHGIRRLVLSDNDLCRAGYDPLEGTRLPPTTQFVSRIFTSAAKPSSGVEWLEMANCGLNDLPNALVDTMVAPATLQRLDLSRNNLRDRGTRVLGEGLANAESSLTFLDVSQNNITTEGGRVLAAALRTNRSMRILRCYNGARLDEEKCGLVDAIVAHRKLEQVDLQKACMHEVRATLERNRTQRSKDSVPHAEVTREKIREQAKLTSDTKEAVKEERHRLEHQLDVLKIMRERAKSTGSNQTATVNAMTNETLEWRANYEEQVTRHKELHEDILSKQQKLNRVLEDATRAADKETSEKSQLLGDAWLVYAEFEARNYTRCEVAPPALPPPGAIRAKLDHLKAQERPDDEELALERELERLRKLNADQKSTCDMYMRKMLELGVDEDAIESVFPKPEKTKEDDDAAVVDKAATEAQAAVAVASFDAALGGAGAGAAAPAAAAAAAAAPTSTGKDRKPGGKKPKPKKPKPKRNKPVKPEA